MISYEHPNLWLCDCCNNKLDETEILIDEDDQYVCPYCLEQELEEE